MLERVGVGAMRTGTAPLGLAGRAKGEGVGRWQRMRGIVRRHVGLVYS